MQLLIFLLWMEQLISPIKVPFKMNLILQVWPAIRINIKKQCKNTMFHVKHQEFI